MELKVWVEGIQRIVCGVTDATTCQDVVFALAFATGKTGRFTLIERWRNNERLLAPNETPLKILMKWGEYSSDVQFILQRSDKQQPNQPVQSQQQINRQQQKAQPNKEFNEVSSAVNLNKTPEANSSLSDRNKETRKSFNIVTPPEKSPENIGIVKGIPQNPLTISPSKNGNDPDFVPKNVTKNIAAEFNSADVRNSLDRKLNTSSGSVSVVQRLNMSNENLLDLYNNRNVAMNGYNSNSSSSPVISSNGALNPPPYQPPPYRQPPAPRNSPNQHQQKFMDVNHNKIENGIKDVNDLNDVLMQSSQYRDLIQLIKFQRDKITNQQSDLTKFDAEIVYLENKGREQMQQLEAISQELSKTDQMYRQGGEQMQTLQYVEEENELVRQQEKTLKSEITLLRSKLFSCESELLQCKNKIRLLMDEIHIEQRNYNRQYENRQLERHLMGEVDRLQADIDHAIQNSDTTTKTADNLKKEVFLIETTISEKKKQLEQLVHEMKEVNLQSLTVAPSSEEVRHFLEGSIKPGSSRRIIGSPRQLENAVPTSKNPHGVWV